MSLKTKLMDDMKSAMKAKDRVKLDAIRFLLSEIKNFEIDHEGDSSDESIQKVIAKQVKQMRDAITEYDQGGRSDLVEAESAKLAVLEEYLPAQMSDDELKAIVEKVLTDLDSPNMGQAMQVVMAKVKDQADGSRVSKMVGQLLKN